MEKEYGLLYYDIPSDDMNFYYRLKRVIDKTCVPVNLSVYIFNWGLKNALETKFTEMGAFKKATIGFVKFDNTSKEQLEKLAVKQLEKLFAGMKKRIDQTISRLHDVEKRKEYLERTGRKLKSYSRLLEIYDFTHRVIPALDILKKTINEEWKICEGKMVT